MLVYKDKCFCPFWKKCKKGNTCSRALTDKIQKEANTSGMLIDRFINDPICFEEKNEIL